MSTYTFFHEKRMKQNISGQRPLQFAYKIWKILTEKHNLLKQGCVGKLKDKFM